MAYVLRVVVLAFGISAAAGCGSDAGKPVTGGGGAAPPAADSGAGKDLKTGGGRMPKAP